MIDQWAAYLSGWRGLGRKGSGGGAKLLRLDRSPLTCSGAPEEAALEVAAPAQAIAPFSGVPQQWPVVLKAIVQRVGLHARPPMRRTSMSLFTTMCGTRDPEHLRSCMQSTQAHAFSVTIMRDVL